jgi:hypothetical protein
MIYASKVNGINSAFCRMWRRLDTANSHPTEGWEGLTAKNVGEVSD